MPKTKKTKQKPCQTFEYKLVLKTYGSSLRHYALKDILNRIFEESVKYTTVWNPVVKSTIAKEKHDCSICLNAIEKNQHVAELKCKHKFHKKCFKNWCESKHTINHFAPPVTCPMCRRVEHITYKQDIKLAGVTTYSLQDDDSVFVQRNILQQKDFDKSH